MAKSIVPKHEKIFDLLLKLQKNDNDLFFVPRKINNKNRLRDGYWFIGNENYLQVSFWDGMDWKEKVHNIAFVVRDDGSAYLEFSAQDSNNKAVFLEMLTAKLRGFTKIKNKNKWYREYSGINYTSNLKDFIKNEKPIIDDMIRKYQPDEIFLLNKNSYNKNIKKIITLRQEKKVLKVITRFPEFAGILKDGDFHLVLKVKVLIQILMKLSSVMVMKSGFLINLKLLMGIIMPFLSL